VDDVLMNDGVNEHVKVYDSTFHVGVSVI